MCMFRPIGEIKAIKIDRDQQLASGRFSKVFIGEFDTREVAVKRIEKDDVKFKKEADELRRLHHQNIVRYYFFDSDDDFEYVVMERCECSLGEHLNTQQNVDELSVMKDICHGLHYLHKEGIIHRNIHTSNILISRHGDIVRAKISDFGIAKHTPDGSSVSLSSHSRSVRYNNPEELNGKNVSKKSDIYALGLCFYTILSRKKSPFGEEDILINGAIEKGYIPDLSAIRHKFTGYGSQLILEMLSPDKKKRPTILEVLNHYIFWEPGKIVRFFTSASDYIKGTNGSEFEQRVRNRSPQVTRSDWWNALYDDLDEGKVRLLRNHFQRHRPGYGLIGLLRKVRNFAHHIRELYPVELGEVFENSPNKMILDITFKFPLLLPVLYEEFKEMKRDRDFAEFYLSQPKD